MKMSPLLVAPISLDGSLDSPIAADVPVVAATEAAVCESASWAVPATTPTPAEAALVVDVVVSVTVAVVDEAACSVRPPRLSEAVGADVVGVDPDEQPGSFTETQAGPVADTVPTGVSAPADAEAA